MRTLLDLVTPKNSTNFAIGSDSTKDSTGNYYNIALFKLTCTPSTMKSPNITVGVRDNIGDNAFTFSFIVLPPSSMRNSMNVYFGNINQSPRQYNDVFMHVYSPYKTDILAAAFSGSDNSGDGKLFIYINLAQLPASAAKDNCTGFTIGDIDSITFYGTTNKKPNSYNYYLRDSTVVRSSGTTQIGSGWNAFDLFSSEMPRF